MPELVQFSREDVLIIQRLLDRERRRPINTTGTESPGGTEDRDQSPAHSYLAKTPAAGIPGMVVSGSELRAGKAECEIYEIVPATEAAGHSLIKRIGEMEEWVFNPSPTPVPGGAYLPILLDSSGVWVPAAGGAGDKMFRVTGQTGEGFAAEYSLTEVYATNWNGTTLGGAPYADVPGGTVVSLGATPPGIAKLVVPASHANGAETFTYNLLIGHFHATNMGPIVMARRASVQPTDPELPRVWEITGIVSTHKAEIPTSLTCEAGEFIVGFTMYGAPGILPLTT